jgi:phenylalanyl-tRNA synthetase beta chain
MGRIVRNVKVKKSPDWLKEKLEAIGQKSINNLVDAANFVMFDLGQPIHCFDLDKLASEKIIVRNGKIGEKIITLDKKEVNLDESILIIADGSTGSPQAKEALAIAGIKGGMKAEVDDNTKNIVIEVANFDAVSTRKTSRKIGILTDAVKRYENEITPNLCEQTMKEITDLIFNLTESSVEESVDIYAVKPKQNVVFVSVDYINKRLGTFFSKEEIKNVWERLDFEYEEENDEFKILVPLSRLDISGPHDLTEDVIKILGYERIKGELPEINWLPKINENFYKILFARNKFLDDGYSEVMTYSFRNKGEIEVLASASDKKFLRTNLSDGLRESLKLNQLNAPLLEMDEIKIFEIGTVFKKGKEEMHVAYADKKNIIEVSLDEFILKVSDAFSEWSGRERDPGDRGPEEKIFGTVKTFKPWSIYPFISRDIAVWVPENILSDDVEKIIKNNAGDLLILTPRLFDEFKKDGKTSYAFRLVFQSYERTLLDSEINEIMTKITNKIKEKNDWQVR